MQFELTPPDIKNTMEHKTSSGITAIFVPEGRCAQPVVSLRDVPRIPGNCDYFASRFLEAAALGVGFSIASGWPDSGDYEISPQDVQGIADFVRSNSDISNGRFEVRWVASDPSVPF